MQGRMLCRAFNEVTGMQLCQDNYITLNVKLHKANEKPGELDNDYYSQLYQKYVSFVPVVEN